MKLLFISSGDEAITKIFSVDTFISMFLIMSLLLIDKYNKSIVQVNVQ